MINIINIVDSGEKLNFGVWNASIATAKELRKLGFKSEIWIPKPTGEDIIEENGFVKHFIEFKGNFDLILKSISQPKDFPIQFFCIIFTLFGHSSKAPRPSSNS